MKSREGTVVDADDLIQEMANTAKDLSEAQGKLSGLEKSEIKTTLHTIALAALKYFILKVDPKKNMTFIPEDSIDFNGNTGPFIQYTYARIKSVIRKAPEKGINIPEKANNSVILDSKEQNLIRFVYSFTETIQESGRNLSPAIIANYVYDLAKEFNQFYHDLSILGEENEDKRDLRILLSILTGNTIKSALSLLGISVPERM